MLEKDVIEIDQLKKKVIELGMESLSPEDKQEISNPNSPYFNDPDNFILSKLSFYLCHTVRFSIIFIFIYLLFYFYFIIKLNNKIK